MNYALLKKIVLITFVFMLSYGTVLAGYDDYDPYDEYDTYNTESSPVKPCQVYAESSPIASHARMRSTVVKDTLAFRDQKMAAPAGVAADLWYQGWEMGDIDGDSYGGQLAYTRGSEHNFKVTVPIFAANPDIGENMTSIGIDGAYRWHVTDFFAVGGHVNYIYDSWSGNVASNDSFTIGPFVAVGFDLTDKFKISGALLYDYTTMSEADLNDSFSQLVPGISLSYRILDSLTVDVFAMYYVLFDLADEQDDGYYDAGVQMRYDLGGWLLSLTVMKTFDLDGFEAEEIHLGTVFTW